MPPTLLEVPPRISDLPTFLFALSWVNILTLGTAIFMFGRKGWDGHALLVQPSKSHRGIAKIFAQVNSLQKIIAKSAIRTQKDFFKHCSYVYTTRDSFSIGLYLRWYYNSAYFYREIFEVQHFDSNFKVLLTLLCYFIVYLSYVRLVLCSVLRWLLTSTTHPNYQDF